MEKLQLDVTSDENVQRVLDLIVEREGKVDVVVNNAGMIAPGTSTFFGLSDQCI